jgi:arginyl-tRNA synthetase
MMMKQEIIKKIEKILKDLGVAEPKVALEYPAHIEKGDLSTNVAMAHAKELGKKPLDVAQEVATKISLGGVRANAVAPGFLNFFFDAAYFNAAIRKPFEKGTVFAGQKTIVEYTDPNPFKEFHIGHLMPNVIGESISRIVEANGAEVKRANYQGDVGLHVAKAVWAIKNGADLSAAYAQGHKAYEEGGAAKDEIIEINKKIYDKSDPAINDIYEEGRQKSLLYFEVLYKILGTTFDYYFFESEVADFGKETVEKNIGKVFEKGDEGAVVFKGENFDKKLHTRVFINKDGLPTYEAKELGLAKVKYDRFPYDVSIVVTANEINEYFKVLLKAMSLVFPELAAKTKHISHGILKLPTGKMSSRTGTVITAESLLSQIKEKVKDRVDDAKIVEEIAVGAVKYSILRQAVGSDIIFDFDKSISFEGDSGPYLQYSTVRAKSLLVKAEGVVELSENLPEGWQTTNLERLLERFGAIVERAGREYAPSQLVTYLTELAGEFNSFYNSGKIIDAENAAVSGYKLALTKTFADVMEKGLDLLGIKVPEKM